MFNEPEKLNVDWVSLRLLYTEPLTSTLATFCYALGRVMPTKLKLYRYSKTTKIKKLRPQG